MVTEAPAPVHNQFQPVLGVSHKVFLCKPCLKELWEMELKHCWGDLDDH